MTSARTYCAVLCLAVLAMAAIAACSLTAAAPASGLIRIPLPASDAAVCLDASGMAAFTGTDIQNIGQTGEPSLPCQSIRVLLPPDADLSTVKVTVTGYRWTGIDGEWDIPPVAPFVTGDGEDTCAVSPADEAIAAGRDAGIYESDALFPLEPVLKVDVQVLREWKMAQVLYAPFAYNPVEKKLYHLSGNAIEITFERTSLESSSAGTDLTSAEQVRDMTVNFAEMSGEYSGFAVSADTGRYVIITTSAIQTASSNLMAFVASKEARGFTVQVVTEGTWQNHSGNNDTGDAAAEHIRSWLQANYVTLNIKYVLLIGNPNPSSGDVPMKMCYPQAYDAGYPECPTDFYYAELTSNWDTDSDGHYGEYYNDFSGNPPRVAEVAVGRIPYYGTITDLDHILSKIIDYETLPETDISWRRNVLLPMNPSDGSTPGYQLGEEIKDDVLVPNDWAYHRVYDSNYGLDPTPETMPCTITNVTNTWNGSDFGAVFWWAHGSETSAQDIMDVSRAATLDDEHLGFTFQCSCLNGKPEATNNLGYSLLKNGCISTISASRVSWYQPEQTSFAGTPTNSGMTFEYAKRLIADEMYAADALNDLKADIWPYDEVLWMNYLDFNLYGCPAVGLFTPPLVETDEATSLTTTSARLNGQLESLGTSEDATVSFEWGTVSGIYGNETTAEVKNTIGTFYFDRSGLTPGTTYYYRAKAAGWGTSYGDEKSFTTLTTPPSVTTSAVSNRGTTWAILNGDLEDLGTAGNVTVSFEWGLTTAYGNETSLQPGAPVGLFSDNLTGLTAKTTYHFRAKAVGHGTAYGYDRTFTTLTIPPSVTTNDASNLATTSARLNGDLTDKGTASSVTVSFVWGTAPGGPYTQQTADQLNRPEGPFSANLSSLTPGTTYYYRARAVGDGTVYGDEKSFTTLITPPSVTTGDASNIAINGARLNGSLSSLGTAASVSVSFQWGTTSENYTYETTPPESKNVTGTFFVDLSSLASDTTFYYRAKAVGHGDPVYGSERYFTTGTQLVVATLDASGLTFTGATLHGDLSSLGEADNVTVSFVWGTTSDCSNETAAEVKTAIGAFFFDLTGLDPGTTYYYKAKADGGVGPVYGDQVIFTTLSTPPAVTTGNATSLAVNSATLNGSLVNLGTAASVSVSFEWCTESGVYGNETMPVPLSSTGSFSANLGSLASGTTFYYRAKAVGHGGPQFGGEKSFATLAPPTVTTGDASDVTTTSARLNGNLSSPGSAASVTVSFQWGTVSDSFSNETTVEVKASAGTFYFGLTGLTPGTIYYYRAKAEGDGGVVYGEQRSFATSVMPPAVTTDDATDVTADSALLNANLVSLGTKSSVTVSFLWKVSGGMYTETTGQAKTAAGAVSADLSGLAQGTTYYYRVKAVGDGDPVYGDEVSFTTADGAAPVISVASASGITVSGATITWTTDEPATSQVEYGVTEDYDSMTTLDADLVTSHSIHLTHLKAGKVYHYRVVSKDAANNQAVSADGTFTTAPRSGGIPVWAWIILGIGVIAGIVAFVVLLRADRRKKNQAGAAA